MGSSSRVCLLFFSIIGFSSLFLGCFQPGSSSHYVQRNEPNAVLAGQAAKEATLTPSDLDKVALRRYLPYVKSYSKKYGVDWLLVLAVMKQESEFSHDAVSHRGAYGLMQIMPITQIELSEKVGVDETMSPGNNIKAGIYHLRSLYNFFGKSATDDRIRLTLAAYNAGLGRILDARKVARYLGNDPRTWNAVKDALPFLSSSGYSLHQSIWRDGQPQSGYFRNWKQTVAYVDNVTTYREELRRSNY